jgi:RNA polymerase sigma-70 factor (ECF subfamily)
MPAQPAETTYHLIDTVFRQEAAHVLATLLGWLRDFELAEDSLQDAFVTALEHWARDGVPTRPGAWMTVVARRKALDRLRRTTGKRRVERLSDLVIEPAITLDDPEALDTIPDERLKLMLMCCHPALPLEAQVALVLTALGGLTTAEVAHAFLVPIPTMAQRLVRAKRKIKDTGIPFDVPHSNQLAERLDAVLHVIYLIFTEGYSATHGDALIRTDLCNESLRLGRMLNALLMREQQAVPEPQRAEALGLLALMLLHNARRSARLDLQGAIVLLDQQDRLCWDRSQISAGVALLDKALSMRHPGPYQLQAAISALHAEARDPAATDWKQIVLLYGELLLRAPSPVVLLNRGVAIGMAFGPEAGLAELEGLERDLADYHPFHAARAELLQRLGRASEAREALLAALKLCQNQVIRTTLLQRLAQLDGIMN